jgi:hypothetical protein
LKIGELKIWTQFYCAALPAYMISRDKEQDPPPKTIEGYTDANYVSEQAASIADKMLVQWQLRLMNYADSTVSESDPVPVKEPLTDAPTK